MSADIAEPFDPKKVALVDGLCDDLEAEHAELDALVSALTPPEFDHPTPAPGWTVRDQLAHLAYFDEAGLLSATDPDRFVATRPDPGAARDAMIDSASDRAAGMTSDELLAWWRDARTAMVAGFRAGDPSRRLPWYGPDMSVASFITARLMETWAHAQDVFDAFGVARVPSARLRHVAHIGVLALPNSYRARGLEVPEVSVHVDLDAPGGGTWEWGDAESADSVRGPALDFCLVATQRRHVADTALVVDGPIATEWIAIAQTFAGPPGPGRTPGQFPGTST